MKLRVDVGNELVIRVAIDPAFDLPALVFGVSIQFHHVVFVRQHDAVGCGFADLQHATYLGQHLLWGWWFGEVDVDDGH